ncbi:MAG: O-acetylhomoserine aminocarboxypropyltransferase/cysteine synthase family protein [Immundisolibacter sp.]|uniref:O-acetylhomoserine aminocarboxypropyltransferase/cysteine synthase family protein n=1 Tax=Immundisolibacter sp. TaxID=1934948 RepID=UPI003EE3C7CD
MELETLAIHAGYKPDPTTKSVAVPIYQTVAYAFDSAQHGADLFDLKVAGNIYTRIMNPTNDVLEQRVAAMEGGIAALALASGSAAITYTVMNLARAGDNIISTKKLYGGTYNLFAHTLPQFGIETRFVDHDDLKALAAAIDNKTKMVFCETIGNPGGHVPDLAGMAAIAHAAGVPLVVDSTVATPALCRPIEHGADVVIHSLTKYMGGHGTSLGGIIVDSGKFPWAEHADRFPQFSQPDPSYHGTVMTDAFGPAAFIARARVVPLRNMGAQMAPMNAFLIMQGIETLSLRMERHCDNTQKVAEHLKKHSQVSWISYAGLPDHPDHAQARKYLNGRASGILSFGVNGGFDAGVKFLDALQLITRLVNIGDAKSLATHPASTTHRQLDAGELAAAGVMPDMVRLSIGIENVADILTDIDQALKASAG